jgi:hypothetical protein
MHSCASKLPGSLSPWPGSPQGSTRVAWTSRGRGLGWADTSRTHTHTAMHARCAQGGRTALYQGRIGCFGCSTTAVL